MDFGHQKRAVRFYTPEEELGLSQQTSELRKAHLQWCKDRALAETTAAAIFGSFMSDAYRKEWWDAEGKEMAPLFDQRVEPYKTLSLIGFSHALKGQTADLRRWVEGFN